MSIMFGQGVTINVLASCAGLAANTVLEVEEYMQASGTVPKEEWFLVFCFAVEEIERLSDDLIIERLHSLRGQRAFILRWTVGGTRNHSARIKLLTKLGISRAIRVFQIFVAIQMVKIAEILVETVTVRQVFFKIAQVVLAILGGGIALGLEDFGESNVFLLQPGRRTWRADGCQTGTNGKLSGQKCRATCR